MATTIAPRGPGSFPVTEIDGYRDLDIIGQGGFAVVYRARQISVGRDVAIKLLTDPSPDADLVRRFKRESQAVGALSWHPHIAAVVDAGSTALGQAYIVFELLAGGSLEERIENEPLSWTNAVAAMIQVADAVEAAHRADVLHRDIKPANILLDRLGVAKLGDFGIASMQDGSKTETGVLATTVAHAAPELFDGKPASPATDIYALGSTLHTLVSGTAPFMPREGERIGSVIARIASEPPPRPDPEAVPERVATVIAHALAKQPEYRPRSAAAFGQALQDAQRTLGQRVTAMPVTDSQPVAPSPSPVRPVPPTISESTAASVPSVPAPAAPAPPARGGAAAVPSVPLLSSSSATPSARFLPPVTSSKPVPAKPFSRTIAVLSVVALLLAAGVGGLVYQQTQSSPNAIAIAQGGAPILRFDALDTTAMPAPFDEAHAVDRDIETYWGISPGADDGIIGTTYVLKFTEPQTIVRLGINNGTSTELGRVSGIIWGTSIDALESGDPSLVLQPIPDGPGPFTTDVDITTDQIVLAITGVHASAVNAGIAELVIEIEGARPSG